MIYPAELGPEILKIQDCLQICPARAGQVAVTWALGALDNWRRGNAERFSANARDFQAALAQIPNWRIDSIGAFFAYVRHPFEGTSSLDIAKRLATQNGLLLIPGLYFGPDQDRHLRVSFGNLSAESLADLPERFRLQLNQPQRPSGTMAAVNPT